MDKTVENPLFDEISKLSALLFVISEQNALIGKLIDILIENDNLSIAQLVEVTDIPGNAELLMPIYQQLHKGYMNYYTAAYNELEKRQEGFKEVIAEEEKEDD